MASNLCPDGTLVAALLRGVSKLVEARPRAQTKTYAIVSVRHQPPLTHLVLPRYLGNKGRNLITTLPPALLGPTLFDAFPTSVHLGDAFIVSVTSEA